MWCELTESDLLCSVSQKEVDTYRQSMPWDQDGVSGLLARTAKYVRGCIVSGARITALPPDNTIPASLVSAAVDYAAYDLLKRFPVAVSEDRRRARADARALFDAIAEGKRTVEPPETANVDDTPAVTPAAVPAHPERLLD